MFKDDTVVFAVGRGQNEMAALLNEKLKDVQVWLRDKSITLNHDKTKRCFWVKGRVC